MVNDETVSRRTLLGFFGLFFGAIGSCKAMQQPRCPKRFRGPTETPREYWPAPTRNVTIRIQDHHAPITGLRELPTWTGAMFTGHCEPERSTLKRPPVGSMYLQTNGRIWIREADGWTAA